MFIFQHLVALIVGLISGVVFLRLVPILLHNMLLLAALPVLYGIVLTAIINPISVMYMIIYSRVLLEPV
ncbi:MAG: hypothetical protein JNN05_11745, partial [Candidatus Omnitrophica bacterium]|nr:hypothetical protein [Candidatus Omnitrophota bacterium]